MDRDAQLTAEIKTLDGDMQMLVYENYNKFISATETIRRMKENVEAMENEMQRLRANMEDVSQNSESLEDALHEKRTQINKLVRVKRLLHRLDFLSELPQRLTRQANRTHGLAAHRVVCRFDPHCRMQPDRERGVRPSSGAIPEDYERAQEARARAVL